MIQIPLIPPSTQPADLVATINDRIRKINLALTSAAATGTTVAATSVSAAPTADQLVQRADLGTLTLASTTFTLPVTVNPPFLVLVARQDGTGGRLLQLLGAVTADSANLDPTANTISTLFFAYFPTLAAWVMVGQSTTGMIP